MPGFTELFVGAVTGATVRSCFEAQEVQELRAKLVAAERDLIWYQDDSAMHRANYNNLMGVNQHLTAQMIELKKQLALRSETASPRP
jgi:predicted HicB family RNase H-like nuclease